MSLESSSWVEYKYVEIFQQYFVVVKFKEDENYALMSQGSAIYKISKQIILKLRNSKQEKFTNYLISKEVMVVLNLTDV